MQQHDQGHCPHLSGRRRSHLGNLSRHVSQSRGTWFFYGANMTDHDERLTPDWPEPPPAEPDIESPVTGRTDADETKRRREWADLFNDFASSPSGAKTVAEGPRVPPRTRGLLGGDLSSAAAWRPFARGES